MTRHESRELAFILISYGLAYVLMAGLGKLMPGMAATIYGFNFLLGVLAVYFVVYSYFGK